MSVSGQRALFWATMLLAQAAAFIIFKDLADISQWLVQSSRGFTMAVWYNRHVISIVAIAALAVSLWLWMRNRSLCRGWIVAILLLAFIINMYSGLLNPALMFRPQQHEALFVSVDEAPEFMQRSLDWARFGDERWDSVDDVEVIVLEADNGVYAFSDYYLLQPHVAKADTIDGEDVIMTYCGLTNLGIAYSPVIDEQPLELSVMTQLKNNLVLRDANTGEPVQQIWGHMESAPERGRMPEHATIRMPFRSFRELYPDGKVFINEIASFSENPIAAAWDRVVRNFMMYHAVGLQWRFENEAAFPTIKDPDPRLPMKELVYALNVGDDHVAWTRDFIAEQGGVINVEVGSKPVVVSYDAEHEVVAAFYNNTGSPVASVDSFGRLPDGTQLDRVDTLKSKIFWFIYAEFYPGTDVNRA